MTSKKLFFSLSIAALSIASLLLLYAWPNIGTTPDQTHIKMFEESPNYDKGTSRFINRRQKEYDKMLQNFDFIALMKEQIFGKQQRTPPFELPQTKPDWNVWQEYQKLQYIWFGHSTVLLRIEEQNILIDPVFDDASPLPFTVPRFQEPVLSLSEIPVDIVLISHDHYDHLSRKSIQHFIDRDVHFVVPLGVSSYLVNWGIDSKKITELDWWEQYQFHNCTIVATPSQHFSGRTGPKGNKTLWASFVIQGTQEKVFYSGDSGYDIHFQEIGNRLGPFDIAFLEDGQYNKIWYMSHLFPEEVIQAHQDLRAKQLQPIHFGMFQLATHDWDEPIRKVLNIAEQKNIDILLPKIGEIVRVNTQHTIDKWFEIPYISDL